MSGLVYPFFLTSSKTRKSEAFLKSKKIVSKFLCALALTFIIPEMVILLYNWKTLPQQFLMLLVTSTVFLLGIGIYLIWDIIQSIRAIFKNLEEITPELKAPVAPSEDEFRHFGNSIEMISKKITQNMQELQQSAQLLEKTKKELNEALLYIENVVNSMGDALIVIDPKYHIRSFNKAAQDLLSYTEAEVLNQPVELLFDDLGPTLFADGAVIKGKRMTFVTRENGKVPVDVNIRLLADPKGFPLGYVLVARDMRMTLELISRLETLNASLEETIQKRTDVIEKIYDELKMKEAQILQQEKMASIGVLVAGIAHEINNPVGYINSNMEVLQEDVHDICRYTETLEKSIRHLVLEESRSEREKIEVGLQQIQAESKIRTLTEDIRQIVQESRQGVDRIKRIIIDLKKFSHTDENKMELADLNQEIESTLNIVYNELKYKAKVVKEFGPLPSIECFPHQLNQVFMNILVNAAQAMKEQGTISIKTLLKDDYIHVIIEDTGVGIPQENLQKIFDPFFTTKEVGKGTGLGLYIAYGIIEKHQGKISVQSEVGKGTVFTIRLPIHPTWARVEEGVQTPS